MTNATQRVKAQITGTKKLARGIIKASLAPLTGFGMKDIIEGSREIARKNRPIEVVSKEDFDKRLENLEIMFAEIAAKEYAQNGLPITQNTEKETKEES